MNRSQTALAYTSAAIATVGLVVSTPSVVESSGLVQRDVALTASVPDLPDPFGAMQQVFEVAQHQISTGFDFLSLGELTIGTSLLASGFANSFVYAPLASLLTVFDGLIGQDPVWLSVGDYYYLEFDLQDAFDQVNFLVAQAFQELSLGFEQLADGQFNEAAASLTYAFTNIIPDIPLQLMVGVVSLFDGFDGFDNV